MLTSWVNADFLFCAGKIKNLAGVAQLVEHHVANVVVVGSKPIARSKMDSSTLGGILGL